MPPGNQRQLPALGREIGQARCVAGPVERRRLLRIGVLYNVPMAEAQARADEVLERIHLVDAADRPVSTYSGGMRRRLDLGEAELQVGEEVLRTLSLAGGMMAFLRGEVPTKPFDAVAYNSQAVGEFQAIQEVPVGVAEQGSAAVRGIDVEPGIMSAANR